MYLYVYNRLELRVPRFHTNHGRIPCVVLTNHLTSELEIIPNMGTNKQTNKQTNEQTNKQTNKQTDKPSTGIVVFLYVSNLKSKPQPQCLTMRKSMLERTHHPEASTPSLQLTIQRFISESSSISIPYHPSKTSTKTSRKFWIPHVNQDLDGQKDRHPNPLAKKIARKLSLDQHQCCSTVWYS